MFGVFMAAFVGVGGEVGIRMSDGDEVGEVLGLFLGMVG